MVNVIHLASFTSSRSARNVLNLWFGITFEVSAKHAFPCRLLDFQHRLHNFVL